MRTMIIIAFGFALWAACLGIARLVGHGRPSSMANATSVFVAIWLVAAATNMWVGVTQAGYPVKEELPVFLAIFLVPAVVAALVKWKFL